MWQEDKITVGPKGSQNGNQDQEKGEGGRQKRRWRDDLTNYVGTTWHRIAQDRNRWTLLEEGFIQQWMKQPVR